MKALALELAVAPANEPPFASLCERTLAAVGAQVVGLSTFDPVRSEMEVRFAAVHGRGLLSRVDQLLGAHLQGVKMKVPAPVLRRMWGAERFEDLHAVSFGALPKSLDRVFRRVLGVGYFYGVALRHQGELVGSMLLVMPRGAREVPPDELLLLANLAAFMVWRHSVDGTLRAREAQAARGAQAEAVNALARGLAHDFGNLLTAVVGYARLARRDAAPGTQLNHRLIRIEAVASKATELTRRLMELSGRSDERRVPVDLSALADDLAPVLESGLHGPGCEVRFELGEGLPTVLADRFQLGQVALNLAVNACQAMEGRRGRLTISTGFDRLGRATLSRLPVGSDCEAGTYAWLKVEDQGHGMDERTLERLFVPGFTTKPAGNGYGMHIAGSIVRAHGGAIEVQTWPGKGTAIRVLLPVDEPRGRRAPSRHQARPGAKRRAGAAERRRPNPV